MRFLGRFASQSGGLNLERRLAGGAFWSVAGSASSRGLMLLSIIVIGRILGARLFGELGMIQSTVGVFGTVAGLGMGLMATKHLSELRSSHPARAGRILGLSSMSTWISGGAAALLIAVAAPWVARHAMSAPHLGGDLRFASLLLLLGAVNSAQAGALFGFEAFREMAIINIVSAVTTFPIAIWSAWRWGLRGAIAGLVATAAMNCVLYWLTIRRVARRHGVPLSYRGCWKERALLWHFNLPGVANSLVLALAQWGAYAILARQVRGYEQLGIYNAVFRIRQVPETIMGMLLAPVIPVLSDALGRKDTSAQRRIVSFTLKISMLVTIPLALVQCSAPWLTLLPYGSTYQGEHLTVQWVMIGAVVYGLIAPMGYLLTSLGRMWLAFSAGAAYCILFLAGTKILAPSFGAAGLACAFAIAAFLSNAAVIWHLWLKFPEVMRRVEWGSALAWSFVLLGASVWVSIVAPPFAALACGAFFALAFVTWSVRKMNFKGLLLQPNGSEP